MNNHNIPSGLGYSEILQNEYKTRKTKNTAYSLRAFARDLGISSGRLINYINGRDVPGKKNAQKLSQKLKLNDTEINRLNRLVDFQKYMKRGLGFQRVLTPHDLSKIQNWKTWAIYTLFQTKQASLLEPSYFSKQLNINIKQTTDSLNVLCDLQLIQKDTFGYRLICNNVTTTTDVPSASIRKLHKEFINIAIDSLENVDIKLRDISAITMLINKNKLPQAKKMIAEFRGELNKLLEDQNSTELYQLNVQLFPLRHF